MKVLVDQGELVVAILEGQRRVRFGHKHSAGKEKAGLGCVCRQDKKE